MTKPLYLFQKDDRVNMNRIPSQTGHDVDTVLLMAALTSSATIYPDINSHTH